MKVVGYTEKYKNDVIDLILTIQNIEFNVNISLDEQADIKDIYKYFNASGGNFWLALDDDEKLIGTLGLQAITPEIAILKKFFVSSEYRGHKIGAALYNELLKFAQKNNFLEIFLDTPAKATQSHKFYRKAGFEEVTKAKLPIVYQYPDRDSLIFCLKL